MCDEIHLALAEGRRRTPLAGLRGTPGGRRQGPWSVEPHQPLSTQITWVYNTRMLPKTSLLPASLYKVICPRERGMDERHRGGM